MTELPDPATGPEQAAERSDLRELVWNAAAGLSERDRALLDLHLRHASRAPSWVRPWAWSPATPTSSSAASATRSSAPSAPSWSPAWARDDCPDLLHLSGWDGRFHP